MQKQQFLGILKSINTLTPEQIITLRASLPDPDTLDLTPGSLQVVEAAAANFHDSPYCPRCNSENVGGWGFQSGYPRYKCRDCKRTFNAMTETPLARLHLRDKVGRIYRLHARPYNT